MEKKENSHKDHRKRLKTKVKEHGLGCLAYHEVLELLLTYTIPRKDTNPTAHNLIDHFGSFANVIDADFYDLQKVDGIGEESALFLNVLSAFIEIYNKSKMEITTEILNNTGDCVKFFRKYFRIKSNEFMIMACLNKKKKVVKTCMFKGLDDATIALNLKEIVNKVNDANVYSVVLFHTHPNGTVAPSNEDISATQSILNVCLMLGIDFDDHIILNSDDHFSFKHNMILSKMKSNYMSTFKATSKFIDVSNEKRIEIDDDKKRKNPK